MLSQETPELPTQLSSSPARASHSYSFVSLQRLLPLQTMAQGTWQTPPGTTMRARLCREDSASIHSMIPQTNPWDCSRCSQLPGEAAAHTPSSGESSAGISLAPRAPNALHTPRICWRSLPSSEHLPWPRPGPQRGADGRRHEGKAITGSPSGQSTSARQHTEPVRLLPAPSPAPELSQSPRSPGAARLSLAALPWPELSGSGAV